jgi:hypothetical protein
MLAAEASSTPGLKRGAEELPREQLPDEEGSCDEGTPYVQLFEYKHLCAARCAAFCSADRTKTIEKKRSPPG